MQICLGLEICDAELRIMIATLAAMAAKHDKLPKRLLMRNKHYKLCYFFLHEKGSSPFSAHATQIFQVSKTRITSSTFPDPDIFAFDMSIAAAAAPFAISAVVVGESVLYQVQICLGMEECRFVMLVSHGS